MKTALTWIAEQQAEDGSWGGTEEDPRFQVGVTGFACLAMLGDGNTLSQGEHSQAVQRAMRWLLLHQDPETGRLAGEHDEFLYEHSVAALALAEIYPFSARAELQQAAHRSCGSW